VGREDIQAALLAPWLEAHLLVMGLLVAAVRPISQPGEAFMV
jgi:hypothetical protein